MRTDNLAAADQAYGAMLSGGRGADTLSFQSHQGTRVHFSRGDGSDYAIVTNAWRSSRDADNVLVLGLGVASGDLLLSRDWMNRLRLDMGSGDAMTFAFQDYGGGNEQRPFERIEFADGTELSWDELESRGIGNYIQPGAGTNLVGSASNEVLTGGEGTDVLYGLDGNDELQGAGGNDHLLGASGDDTLIGGAGNDVLDGGTGRNTYVLSSSSGNDSIHADTDHSDGLDIIRFDDYISTADIGGDGSMLSWGPYWNRHTATITGAVEIQLPDGTIWTWNAPRPASLVASPGDDSLTGTALDDQLAGGEGRDTVHGADGNDLIDGDDGRDQLSGAAGQDALDGGFGNDVVDGGEGDDLLYGGRGHDSLLGGTGTDTLDGGAGDDILDGGEGADVYLFGRGSGQDTIQPFFPDVAAPAVDTVHLAADITPDDIELSVNAALQVRIKDSMDILYVESGAGVFDSSWDGDYRLKDIVFADGTIWGRDEIKAKLLQHTDGDDRIDGFVANESLYGGAGDDELSGGGGDDVISGGDGRDDLGGADGDDTLIGGAGDDNLNGNLGSDVYVFGRGFGHDLMYGNDLPYATADRDTVRFDSDIAFADLVFSQGASGDPEALVIDVVPTGDRLEIGDYFSLLHQISNVASIEFANGFSLDRAAVIALLSNDGSPGLDIEGTALADQLIGGEENTTLLGYDGNDTLDGGAGNDSLDGGTGQDVIRFGRGSGVDEIYGDTEDRVGDTIELGSDLTPDDIVLTRVGTNHALHDTSQLQIAIKGSNDRLLVWNAFGDFDAPTPYGVGTIQFSNSVSWDAAAIAAHLQGASLHSDVLTGNDSADLIEALDGSDSVYGGAGNDSIVGGSQNDYLLGEAGDDTLVGGAHNDQLFGGAGGDVIDGGAGSDSLTGGSGNDIYVFGRGDGIDFTWGDGNSSGEHDIVRLKASVAPQDITLRSHQSNLVRLYINGTADSIEFDVNFESYGTRYVEEIHFTDGTIWDRDDIKQHILLSTAEDDYVQAFASADAIYGLTGDDSLEGGAGNDTLDGGLDNDTLLGGEGDNLLRGGPNNDVIYAHGDDTVEGGSGADFIHVEYSGYATIRFGRGDGFDYVDAGNVYGSNSIVVLRDDVGLGDIDLRRLSSYEATSLWGAIDTDPDTLEIAIRGTDDAIRIAHFFDIDVANDPALMFADGTVWTRADVLARVFAGTSADDMLRGTTAADAIAGGDGDDVLNGAQGDDSVSGGDGDDHVNGEAGADQLEGGAGADTLEGGLGNDTLDGGFGDDVYVFRPGAGADTIVEMEDAGAGRLNVLQVASGINASDIVSIRNGDDLYISRSGTTDKVKVTGFFANGDPYGGSNPIQRVEFADGTSWSVSDIEQLVAQAPVNNAPSVAASLPDQQIPEGYLLVFALPAGAFVDSDPGDTLSFSAVLSDGSPLPPWLTFDSATRTFQGRAESLLGGAIEVKVQAMDRGGLTANALFTLSVSIEDMNLVGDSYPDQLVGLSGNDTLMGQGGNDELVGNAGDDLLDGGSGTDTMLGGIGSDTYVASTVSDVITEFADEGWDTVQTSLSWVLGANLERVVLTGTSSVNATGNEGNNELVGNTRANVLDGRGGADTLIGGLGNDRYVVDGAEDVVVEAASGGTDTVESSVGWILGTNIEGLTLTGAASTSAAGNNLNNTLRGNSADNVLDGAGGNDTMIGGAGDDVYAVSSTGDVVTEAAGAGFDTVETIVTLSSLAANVERLVLLGSAALNGTGNSLDNELIGNGGNNRLSGGSGNDLLDGGAGNDSLTGGAGDDTYFVDAVADSVIEASGGGLDTVNSSVTHTLASNVENLLLTGATAINGTGNASANLLMGNDGANTLSGGAGSDTLGGGAGADALLGGLGADFYRFGIGDGVDTIQENDNTSGSTDSVLFDEGIEQLDVVFTQNGDSLNVSLSGTDDAIVVQDWYLGSRYRIEAFQFADGSTILESQVQGLVDAMAAFASTSADALQGSPATHHHMIMDRLSVSAAS